MPRARIRVRIRGPFCMICRASPVEREKTTCPSCFARMTHYRELERQKQGKERLKQLESIPGGHEKRQDDPEIDQIYSGDLIEPLISKDTTSSKTQEASEMLNELAASGQLMEYKKRRAKECPAGSSGSVSKSKPRVRLRFNVS